MSSQGLYQQSTGNDLTGDFSQTETSGSSTSFTQLQTNQSLTVTLTEVDQATETKQGLGNAILGGYSWSETGSTSSYQNEHDHNQSLDTYLTQWSKEWSNGGETGNQISASYTIGETAPGTCTLMQSDSNQSLSQGQTQWTSDSATLTQSGDSISGDFSIGESAEQRQPDPVRQHRRPRLHPQHGHARHQYDGGGRQRDHHIPVGRAPRARTAPTLIRTDTYADGGSADADPERRRHADLVGQRADGFLHRGRQHQHQRPADRLGARARLTRRRRPAARRTTAAAAATA